MSREARDALDQARSEAREEKRLAMLRHLTAIAHEGILEEQHWHDHDVLRPYGPARGDEEILFDGDAALWQSGQQPCDGEPFRVPTSVIRLQVEGYPYVLTITEDVEEILRRHGEG